MSTLILRIRTLAPRGARALAGVAALLIVPACGGDGKGPPTETHTISVTTTGRLERGNTVSVTVTDNGQAVAEGSYTLTANPSDALVLLGGGQVKLARAGTVTVTASAGGNTGQRQFTIDAPPVVVFDRVVGGNRDIWRVDLDGQNLAAVTTDPAEDQDPTVAAGKVVWVSYRIGNGELYSMPLAGGTVTRLTTNSVSESTPSLSTDGSKLAYTTEVGGVTKVFSANADATGAVRVTPTGFGFSGAIETAPSWAGTKLAFVSTANGSADIFQSSGSGNPLLLVTGDKADVEPAWSPDGNTLAFVSNRNGGTDIFLLNVASGAITQLTTGAGAKSQPAWTPDGRLVYTESLNGTRLRWVDVAQPADAHTIDTGAGTVGHPTAIAAP